MTFSLHVPLAILLGPALWLAGAIVFDVVHWFLHAMLRSRFRPLRALAWPHAVHHEWIDHDLQVHWDRQSANVWCHLVPEYLTQLAFTGVVWRLLPLPYAVVLFALQTTVFAFMLRARGLDVNHRPIEMLDAYRPGFLTPPAYHALHHAYPDAHFSAYTKAVDWLVGGGTPLRGRRIALVGAGSDFGRALAAALKRAGVEAVDEWDALEPTCLERLDVLVLCDAALAPTPAVDAYVRATRRRRLPPEVWAVHTAPDDPMARRYYDDVRVNYRVIVCDAAGAPDARIALRRIRRGFNFVSTAPWWRALIELRRFRRTAPTERPVLRHRTELP